ncbi:MAG: Tat pathway signal protein [Candidatus Latescibacterota bacterium]
MRTADELIWGYLLHLGFNMWADAAVPGQQDPGIAAQPVLRCDPEVWAGLTARMAAAGLNMVVIDLGDGVRYDSHPEIAVRRAWSPSRLRRELGRLRRMGLEPIPKLNFSTCHDTWLGPYARMVSTDAYYAVCRDLIAEVIALFDRPRFFHLGMDEETAEHQRLYEYVVIRQHDLWWRDLLFYTEEVARGGSRPWVWSDYVWHHPEAFHERMPRSVLQSNWYYYEGFSTSPRRNRRAVRVRTYCELDAAGYEQVPAASNYVYPESFQHTVDFCRRHVAPERLLGFLQTVWRPTVEEWQQTHREAIAQVGRARQGWSAGRS